jgi:hypothetical protein
VKAISLHQPWASLFVAGAKLIETRSWATKYRGTLAVHAAKTVDIQACHRYPFYEALIKLGFDQAMDLPLGAVLGTVTLVDCLEMASGLGLHEGKLFIGDGPGEDQRLAGWERDFGLYQPGRFAWVTSFGGRYVCEPIPLRGFQKVWNLPDEIAAKVAA